MPRAQFNADLIEQLKTRVTDHNLLAKSLGLDLVRLQDLKSVYTRGYKRTNPEQRAMRKVDEYLASVRGEVSPAAQDLAKAGNPNEGRDRGGRFMGFGIKDSPADHERMQDESAGYNALTSDVVPEHRWSIYLPVAANAASAGLTGVLGYSLYHGKRAGIARTISRGAGRAAVGVPVRLLASIVGRAALAGENSFHRLTGKRPLGLTVLSVADAAASAGNKVGAVAASGLDRGAVWAHRALHGAADVMSHSDAHENGRRAMRATLAAGGSRADAINRGVRAVLQERLFRNARRAAVVGAAGYGVYKEINGFLEPFATSRAASFDAMSYRSIRKSAIDDPQAQDLLKAFRLPPTGQLIGAGLAAAGGAAAAAGGRVAVHALSGDHETYHDQHGRFTSKDKAVQHHAVTGVVAALGGGLAATAALLSFRRMSRNALAASAREIIDRYSQTMGALERGDTPRGDLHRPGYNHPDLVEMSRDRAGIINKHIEDNEDHYRELQLIDERAGNAPLHYTNAVRQAIDDHVVEQIAASPKFGEVKIPLADGVQSLSSLGTAAKRREAFADFVSKATPAQMKAALKPLSATDKASALDVFDQKEAKIADVGRRLDLHGQRIVDAEAAHKAAADKLDAIDSELRQHRAGMMRSGGTPTAAVAKKEAKLDGDLRAQNLVVNDLGDAADDLKSMDPLIPHPVIQGQKIEPASDAVVSSLKHASKTAARSEAIKAYVNRFEALRSNLIKSTKSRLVRAMLAHARIGGRYNALPTDVEAVASAYTDSYARARQAEAGLKRADRLRREQSAVLAQIPVIDAERHRAQATIVKDLSAALTEAKGAHAAAQSHLIAAADAYETALRSAPAVPPKVSLLNSVVGHAAAHDLRVGASAIKTGVAAAAQEIIDNPSAKALGEFAAHVGSYVTWGANGVGHAVKRVAQEATGTVNNGAYEFSPTRTLASGTFVPAAATAGYEYYRYAHGVVDHQLGRGGDPALPRHLHYDSVVKTARDPLTGVGYTAVTLPDHRNPGQRIILWGERIKDERGSTQRLHAGSNFADLDKRHREDVDKARQTQGGGQQNSDVRGARILNDDALNGIKDQKEKDRLTNLRKVVREQNKAVTEHDIVDSDGHGDVRFRKGNAGGDAAHQAGKSLYTELRSRLDAAKRGDVLNAVVSHEGRILKLNQAFELLTGHREDKSSIGSKQGGALGADSDFGGDAEDAAGALRKAIATSGQRLRDNPGFRAEMHKAVAIVAKVRGIGADERKKLHAAVDGIDNAPAAEAAEVAPAPQRPVETPSARQTSSPSTRSFEIDDALQHDGIPSHWNAAQETQYSDAINRMVEGTKNTDGMGARLELNTARDRYALSMTMHTMGMIAAAQWPDDVPPPTPGELAHVAYNTLHHALTVSDGSSSGEDLDNLEALRDSIVGGHHYELSGPMHRAIEDTLEHRRRRVQKAHMLDDLSKAAGSFGPSLAKSSGGGIAARVIGETADAAIGQESRKATSDGEGGKSQGVFNPVRLTNDVANFGAGEAAWQGAKHYLPKAVGVLEKPAAGLLSSAGLKYGASWLGREAVTIGAGGVGSLAGSALAGAALSAGYGLEGKKAPGYNPAPYKSPGSAVAETAGQIVGGNYGQRALQLGAKWLPRIGRAVVGVGEGVGEAALGAGEGAVEGGALGGLPGAIIGGALGGYAGATALRSGYDALSGPAAKHFKGYDTASVTKATRHLRSATSAPAATPAPAV